MVPLLPADRVVGQAVDRVDVRAEALLAAGPEAGRAEALPAVLADGPVDRADARQDEAGRVVEGAADADTDRAGECAPSRLRA